MSDRMKEVMETVADIYFPAPNGEVPYASNSFRKYIHKVHRALRNYERLEGHPQTVFAIIEAPGWVLRWRGALPQNNPVRTIEGLGKWVILHSGHTGISAAFDPEQPPHSVKAVQIRDQTKDGLHRHAGRKRIME